MSLTSATVSAGGHSAGLGTQVFTVTDFWLVRNSPWIGVLRSACLVCVADAEYPLALGDHIKIWKRC